MPSYMREPSNQLPCSYSLYRLGFRTDLKRPAQSGGTKNLRAEHGRGGEGEHRPHVLDLKLGEQPTEAEGIRFSPKLHQDRCTRYRLFHHNSWLKALSLRVPQPRRFLSCWHRGNRSSLPLCLYVSSLYSCFLVLFFRDRISLVAFVGLKLVAIPLPPRLEC